MKHEWLGWVAGMENSEVNTGKLVDVCNGEPALKGRFSSMYTIFAKTGNTKFGIIGPVLATRDSKSRINSEKAFRHIETAIFHEQ